MLILILSAFTLIAALSVPLSAQDFWQPSNGPWGGNITALATASDGSMLAGTYSRGMYRSTNQGTTWTPVQATPADTGFHAIVTTVQGTVLAATASNSLYRSTDNGLTWTATPFAGGSIVAFAMTPDNDIYASTRGNSQTGLRGIFRSTDMGQSWTPTDTTVIWASTITATAQGIFAANFHELYRSTNNGDTWQLLDNRLDQIKILTNDSSGNLYALATDPQANAGMFASSDNGDNWLKIDSALGSIGRDVIAIAPDGAPLIIWRDTVYWLERDSQQWQRSGLPSSIVYSTTPVIFTSKDEIYIGGRGGVTRSFDHRMSWKRVSTGIATVNIFHLAVNAGGTVIAGSDAGILRSTDTTNSWNVLPDAISSGDQGVSVMPNGTPHGIFFVRDLGGIWRSTNNGNDWDNHLIFRGESHFFPLAIGLQGDAYTVTNGPIIYRSLDSGKTWEGTGTAPKGVRDLMVTGSGQKNAITASSPEGIYMATNGRIFRSTDKGGTWDTTTSKAIYPIDAISVLEVDSNGDVVIGTRNLAGKAGSVYRLHKNGNTWNIDSLGPVANAATIVVATDGAIYIGGDQGAFRSTDDGKTWKDISSGLRIRSVTSLAIHPDGHLLAGLAGGSVVRSTERVDAPASVKTHDDYTTPTTLSSVWATSDPLSCLITIHFSPTQPEHLTIDIFNSDAQHITQLLNTEVTPAMQQVVWNTENVVSGRYFCRITHAQQSTVLPIIVIR